MKLFSTFAAITGLLAVVMELFLNAHGTAIIFGMVAIMNSIIGVSEAIASLNDK